MSVLKTCPYCGGHGYINQFEDVEGGCRAWANECIACKGTGAILVPETNADRIRHMSDEELAVFLDDLTCLCVDCNDHDGVNENCPIYKQGCGRYCEPKDLMDWLQQPVKEDT